MVEDDTYSQYVFHLYGEISRKAGLDKQRAEIEKRLAERAETQLNIE